MLDLSLMEINQEEVLKNSGQVNSSSLCGQPKTGLVQQPCPSASVKPSTGPLVDRAEGILEQSLEIGNSVGYVGTTIQLGIGGK